MLAPPQRPLCDGAVTLRAWRAEDRDTVVAALQDPEIPRWTRVPSPYGPEDFDAWMAEQAEQLAAGTGLHFLVTDADGRILGATGVQHTEDDPDIGYWTVREHRGRGHTSRAVRLLCRHVLALGFARVAIFVHEDNVASQRVAMAAGFSRAPGTTTVARLGGGAVYVRFAHP